MASGNYVNKNALSYFKTKLTQLFATKAELNELKKLREITLTTSWSSNTQTVNLAGITSSDTPIIYVKKSGTIDQMKQQDVEFSKVINAVTQNGSIKFTCSEPTTISLTLIVKGE